MLAVGHATVDFYQGAVPALVPFLAAGRHYGYAAASGVVLAATLLSSIVQPLFGASACVSWPGSSPGPSPNPRPRRPSSLRSCRPTHSPCRTPRDRL
jgi:hypothetical protein